METLHRINKSVIACVLAAGMHGCSGAPQRTEPVQAVRVVDENGHPAADVQVRLLEYGHPNRELQIARSDGHGIAWFEDVPPGRYEIDAADPPRWNIARNEIDGRSAWLGGDLVTIPMHELRLVGVRLPGGRLIGRSEGSWDHHEPARLEAVRESRQWPRDALVLHAFRSLGAPPDASHMEFSAEWYGYAPHVERQAWTPDSAFDGPRIVDVSELEAVPWRELPVVLRDPEGTPLPTETMHVVRRQCELIRRDDLQHHRRYSLEPLDDRQGRVALPCGEYLLRLHHAGPWHDIPLSVGEDAAVIDCALPVRLRLLRLRLGGVVGENWSVRANGAGHSSHIWLPTPDRVVEIPLFLGESELVFENHLEDGVYQRKTRSVVIRDEDVTEIEWDVSG